MPGAEYVFISSGDGRNTWMNLDGRDVRLKLIKSPKPNNYPYRSYYRWGKVSIVALFENYKRKDQPSKEDDPTTQVTITLRRGRGRVRTVRAVGEADC